MVMAFPQVQIVASQTGRPDDGTDVTGFYNNEFDVLLYPEDDWKPHITKDELIDTMNKKLSVIPGVDLNFSQPISDNIEEAVSGVKGSICVKVYGDSLDYMEAKVTDVYNILKTVRGIEDLGVIKNIGQPEVGYRPQPADDGPVRRRHGRRQRRDRNGHRRQSSLHPLRRRSRPSISASASPKNTGHP